MLAGQTRIASRLVTLAGGGVAAGAGGQTGFQVATAVDGFAALGQFGIGNPASHGLRSEMGCDVSQVLITQVGQHAGHFWYLTGAISYAVFCLKKKISNW